MGLFYGFYFTVVLPKMKKQREEAKKQALEEKMLKEQVQTAIEKERLERELMKKKMEAEAEDIARSKKPRFCAYCGSSIPADSSVCPSCGSRKQHH